MGSKYRTMKMYRTFKITGIVLLLFVIGNSCKYDWIEFEEINVGTVSFEGDIIPIFNKSCNISGCHFAGSPILDLSPETAYDDLWSKSKIDTVTPEESKIYLKLSSVGSTHAGRSTVGDQSLILNWIKQGAKDN